MAMGQAPGAQPSGPGPVQPGQVGGAGQPMTMIPGMNEMRNGSNVAAAGMAPGGVGVPGRQVGEAAAGGPGVRANY